MVHSARGLFGQGGFTPPMPTMPTLCFLSDLTPPAILLQDTPSALSNMVTYLFRFHCQNENLPCIFMCDVHVLGEVPQFRTCHTVWLATDLMNGVNYVFSVFATDAVGNVGGVVTHMWKIGKLACTYVS